MDNPYDRRQRGDNTDAMQRGTMIAGFAPSFEMPRALAIQDLDALAYSAHSRGVEAESQRLARQHADEVHAARREAWAEGHGTGMVEGQQAMLRSMDEQHGSTVRAAIDDGAALLESFNGNPRNVTKGALRVMLAAQTRLLQTLLDGHHSAFVRQLPF